MEEVGESKTHQCFTYDYPTPMACTKAGCTKSHLVLKDLAISVGRAWEGSRPGKVLRDVIRSEIVFGRSLKGTRNVPCAREIATNVQGSGKSRKYFRRVKHIPSTRAPALASLATGRDFHYWHPGDPDIMAIKRLLISEIPANAALGQDCAICMGNVHDTNDADEVYCADGICPHKFHRTCICEWFGQCESTGLELTCPECRRLHPYPSGETAGGSDSSAGSTTPTAMCACTACAARSSHGGEAGGGTSGYGCGSGSSSSSVQPVHARNDASADSSLPAEGVGLQPSTTTRKRRVGELCALADPCKSSLDSRRRALAERCQRWDVGDAIEARFGTLKGGTAWYRGQVSCVHNLDAGRVYDIAYVDGDEEFAVLAKYVRDHTEGCE
mmetsp:Transcript_13184/g.33784  ORF Transcript_13184/g.33784 Transcript_13184/m.33784 type:complete len:385 (+) Transcript_13184:34-1188(+)